MIRFIPDSWLEALLRFFAMVAPDGNVYVEIPAPDLRFAAIVLLALAVALCSRRLTANRLPAVALLVFVLVCTVPWLLTSGNGRYWIPVLLSAGPLAVGLAYLLPLTRSFKLFLAGGLLAAQTFVVLQISPWDSWTWVAWAKAPYFQIEVPAADPSLETTYVTLSSISYSLIAPQFPPSARWINLTSVGGTGRDKAWAEEFLSAARGPVELIAPSIRGQVGAGGQPTAEIKKALDSMLATQKLALAPQARCELLHSRGLSLEGHTSAASAGSEDAGFWVCPLRYPVEPTPQNTLPLDRRTEAAFARIEQMCPRFFPPGAVTVRINGGALRHYPGSDMKAYVLDGGDVMYKFWRALNPVLVGKLDDILSGKSAIDCDHIRGRAGLPWDREI